MAPTTAILTTPSKRSTEAPPTLSPADPTPPSIFPAKTSVDFTNKVTVADGGTLKASTPELSAKSSVEGTNKVNVDGDEVKLLLKRATA
uniref:Uncharacterized protein n=1 Tax=Lactuca sativa TaxID=4236 RepID=A0A9R1W6L2_LACSA|nr:hypothetical protein LSAT_V11C300109610 [Lactuca sativa]